MAKKRKKTNITIPIVYPANFKTGVARVPVPYAYPRTLKVKTIRIKV